MPEIRSQKAERAAPERSRPFTCWYRLAGGQIDAGGRTPGGCWQGSSVASRRAPSRGIRGTGVLIESRLALPGSDTGRGVGTRDHLNGESQVNRHREHHVAVRIDCDCAPVESAEIARIDDTPLTRRWCMRPLTGAAESEFHSKAVRRVVTLDTACGAGPSRTAAPALPSHG